MKPLIRQYIYAKLKKSLYNHEVKRLIWNNPYFPFRSKEDSNSFIAWCPEIIERDKLLKIIERIKSHPNYDKTTRESYEAFLEEQKSLLMADNLTEADSPYNNEAIVYLSQHFNIWDSIERDFAIWDVIERKYE